MIILQNSWPQETVNVKLVKLVKVKLTKRLFKGYLLVNQVSMCGETSETVSAHGDHIKSFR